MVHLPLLETTFMISDMKKKEVLKIEGMNKVRIVS